MDYRSRPATARPSSCPARWSRARSPGISKEPQSVELRLLWYTQGKGDQDVAAGRPPWRCANPGEDEIRPFDIRLPEGPFSFSGKLISLVWALEAVAEPGSRAERLEITVSPTRAGDPAAPPAGCAMRARDNPFAVQRVLAIRYRLSGVTWEELLARLAALRFRAALVGPHGHGKTTLLEDLGERLGHQGFRMRTVTLHQGERRLGDRREAALFRDPHPARSPAGGRRRAARPPGLVAPALPQPGRRRADRDLPPPGLLPTLHECRTTPELLAGIVADLGGERASRPLPALFARHGAICGKPCASCTTSTRTSRTLETSRQSVLLRDAEFQIATLETTSRRFK